HSNGSPRHGRGGLIHEGTDQVSAAVQDRLPKQQSARLRSPSKDAAVAQGEHGEEWSGKADAAERKNHEAIKSGCPLARTAMSACGTKRASGRAQSLDRPRKVTYKNSTRARVMGSYFRRVNGNRIMGKVRARLIPGTMLTYAAVISYLRRRPRRKD